MRQSTLEKTSVRIDNNSQTRRMGEFGNDEAFMVSLMAELADERSGEYPNAFDMKFALSWNDWGYSESETLNFAVVATTPDLPTAVVISKKGMLLVKKAESHERFDYGLPRNLDWLMTSFDWKSDQPYNQRLYGVGINNWEAVDPNSPSEKAIQTIRQSEEYWKSKKSGGERSAEAVASRY